MRISRWTWSTESRPPHRVSGISPPVAFKDASKRDAASSLSSGETLRGCPDQRLLDVAENLVRFFDEARAFLERAPRSVEHRSNFDQPRQRVSPSLRSSPALVSPAWAEAISALLPAPPESGNVVAPLSSTRVRVPGGRPNSISIVSRPAWSSRLVSALLRGAGPPNKASIAVVVPERRSAKHFHGARP